MRHVELLEANARQTLEARRGMEWNVLFVLPEKFKKEKLSVTQNIWEMVLKYQDCIQYRSFELLKTLFDLQEERDSVSNKVIIEAVLSHKHPHLIFSCIIHYCRRDRRLCTFEDVLKMLAHKDPENLSEAISALYECQKSEVLLLSKQRIGIDTSFLLDSLEKIFNALIKQDDPKSFVDKIIALHAKTPPAEFTATLITLLTQDIQTLLARLCEKFGADASEDMILQNVLNAYRTNKITALNIADLVRCSPDEMCALVACLEKMSHRVTLNNILWVLTHKNIAELNKAITNLQRDDETSYKQAFGSYLCEGYIQGLYKQLKQKFTNKQQMIVDALIMCDQPENFLCVLLLCIETPGTRLPPKYDALTEFDKILIQQLLNPQQSAPTPATATATATAGIFSSSTNSATATSAAKKQPESGNNTARGPGDFSPPPLD